MKTNEYGYGISEADRFYQSRLRDIVDTVMNLRGSSGRSMSPGRKAMFLGGIAGDLIDQTGNIQTQKMRNEADLEKARILGRYGIQTEEQRNIPALKRLEFERKQDRPIAPGSNLGIGLWGNREREDSFGENSFSNPYSFLRSIFR